METGMSRCFKAWVTLLAVNVAASLIQPLILLLLNGHVAFSVFQQAFAVSMVYANIIGISSFVLLNGWGNRVFFLPRPYRWFALVAVFLALGASGCLLANVVLWFAGYSGAEDFWSAYFSSLRFSLV